MYNVNQNNSTAELYIDRGGDSKEENEHIFDLLIKNKEDIENIFGEKLDWEKLETKRACRIIKRFPLGVYRSDEEQWPGLHDKMIDAMIRLEKALGPYLKKLKIGA